jgi:hypothetical protein
MCVCADNRLVSTAHEQRDACQLTVAAAAAAPAGAAAVSCKLNPKRAGCCGGVSPTAAARWTCAAALLLPRAVVPRCAGGLAGAGCAAAAAAAWCPFPTPSKHGMHGCCALRGPQSAPRTTTHRSRGVARCGAAGGAACSCCCGPLEARKRAENARAHGQRPVCARPLARREGTCAGQRRRGRWRVVATRRVSVKGGSALSSRRDDARHHVPLRRL